MKRCEFDESAPAPPPSSSDDEDERVEVVDNESGGGDYGGGGSDGDDFALSDHEAEVGFSQGTPPPSPVAEVATGGGGAPAQSPEVQSKNRKDRGRKPANTRFDCKRAEEVLGKGRGDMAATAKEMTGAVHEMVGMVSKLASNQGSSSAWGGAGAGGSDSAAVDAAAAAAEKARTQKLEAAKVNQGSLSLMLQLHTTLKADGEDGFKPEELRAAMSKCEVDLG